VLLQPRWAMSYLRGPLTPAEIRMVRERLRAGGVEAGAELGLLQNGSTQTAATQTPPPNARPPSGAG
jgi:hypothetical protein